MDTPQKDEPLPNLYEAAKVYHQHGLSISPAHDKRPVGTWRQWTQQRPEPADIQRWWRDRQAEGAQADGIFVICGHISNLVVLDLDSALAHTWWETVLGDLYTAGPAVRSGSGRGTHLWYRYPDHDVRPRSVKDHQLYGSWDLRSDGTGVIAPPSTHPEGGRYTWLDGRQLGQVELPVWPFEDDHLAHLLGAAPAQPGHTETGRSTLAWLLDHPGEGGRNNWTARVLGHLAHRFPWPDAYRAMADQMVWPLCAALPGDHPYTRREFDDTVESILAAEGRQQPTQVSAATGWVRGNGRQMWTLAGKDDPQPAKWSNFDTLVRTVLVDVDGTYLYQLDLWRDPVHTANGDQPDPEHPDPETEQALLPGSVLGSNDTLNRWLAARRLVLYRPKGDIASNQPVGSRIQQYLDSQQAPVAALAPWMGWNDLPDHPLGGVYICQEGAVDQAGLSADAPVTVDPRRETEGGVAWTLGWEGDHRTAADLLASVLSYHDPEVCALFGAVWALLPLKGLLMSAVSMFPQIALAAPSESGKTNGFFNLMLQANGRRHPGGIYTAAALRDDLSRHRGGFVWIDDPSNIEDIGELLRACASEGVVTKKAGAQWEQQRRMRLVSPCVVSAEGMAALRERAMADRFVQINVPSPTGRQSMLDGRRDRYQWDDIVAMYRKTGGLWHHSGWYVQAAMVAAEDLRLAWGADNIHQAVAQVLDSLKPTGARGRLAERQACLRLGVRLLSAMANGQLGAPTGNPWWESTAPVAVPGATGIELDLVQEVDRWTEAETELESEGGRTGPYLVEVVLPRWIEWRGYLPTHKSREVEPVWVGSDRTLRVSIAGLATWWETQAMRRGYGARGLQLGERTALQQEAKSIDGARALVDGGKRWWVLPEQVSRRILMTAGHDPDSDRYRAPAGEPSAQLDLGE